MSAAGTVPSSTYLSGVNSLSMDAGLAVAVDAAGCA